MLTIPPLRFVLQDRTQPIPNLNTRLVVGDVVELLCDFAVERSDFINVNMISRVVGGSYNLSFEVGADAPSLKIYMPKNVVGANSGNNVQLLMRIRRGMSYPAPDATVSIDAGGIIVPTPGFVWDFSDGTAQGWNPQSVYAGNQLAVQNRSLVFNVRSNRPGVISSHMISHPVLVSAGRTYKFSFDAIGGAATSDGSILYMTVNGSPLNNKVNVENLTQANPQTGSGEYTATTTGSVQLGIFNQAVPTGPHLISLGNIKMTPGPGLS